MAINALTNTGIGKRNQIITPVKISSLETGLSITTMGLWDTGAQHCVIRHDLASAIGLIPRGIKTIQGVNGKEDRDYYYANLKLNNEEISLNIQITDVKPFSPSPQLGMLIGMDVITHGDFSISNYEGNTIMTFRTPSQTIIDYCKDVNIYNKYLKIHQTMLRHGNNKCPCNSGKPWEKCHGNIVE